MNFVLSENYSHYRNDILNILKNFKNEGILILNDNKKRNTIKFFSVNDLSFNFKSFKQHNIINRHVYKHYRKSKARRSYEYANLLLSKNFHTPQPIAFIENHDFIGVTSSYYVSEQLEDSFTLKTVFHAENFTDRNDIIRSYTLLIHQLHENGIEFLDNAPGNFLIKKIDDSYQIFLVDLNRMNFHEEIDIQKRLKNFSRISENLEIQKIIASEYALLSGNSYDFCEKTIAEASNKRIRKLKIKKVLKLYKYFFKN